LAHLHLAVAEAAKQVADAREEEDEQEQGAVKEGCVGIGQLQRRPEEHGALLYT